MLEKTRYKKSKERHFSSVCFFAAVSFVFVTITIKSGAFAQEDFFFPDPVAGQKIFEAKGCQHCHSIRGIGGDVGKDLGWREYYGNTLDLAANLWNHSPIMREAMESQQIERPQFTKDEMAALMGFLYYQRYYKKTGSVVNGKKLLSQKGCLECHGLQETGGTIAHRLDRLDEYVSPVFMAQAMWNHGPEMQDKMKELKMDWPRFEGEEIVDVTSYLRILRKDSHPDRFQEATGNPETGKELISSKGCVHCHSVRGSGGDIGPDFIDVDFNKNVTEIAGLMWNHGPEMFSRMRQMKVEWPKFSYEEMADLISYLYSLDFLGAKGNYDKGEEVFSSKLCVTCHTGIDGQEPVAPLLSDMEPLDSSIQMAQIMWNHAPVMEAKMSERKLEWPELESAEISNLFEFLKGKQKVAAKQ